LQGTPTSADIGTYRDVVIRVSDGKTTASLAAFTITVQGNATGSARLTWNPPTQNTNGTALTDLAGYRVYWGTSPNNFTSSVTVNNPGITAYVLENLVPGTYYFAVTAFNKAGTESVLSNSVSKTIR